MLRKCVSALSVLLFLALSCTCVLAEDAVYSTVGGTWTRLNDTMYVMDTDGDGNYDVTLEKNGNDWSYYFTVADDSIPYYIVENGIPVGYELVGKGSQSDPGLTKLPIKYSHTANIGDNGVCGGEYAGGLRSVDVVTVPGATQLKVSITYETQKSGYTVYDWACVWDGAHPDYEPYANYRTSRSGLLGGSKTTRSYTIPGDSVTFGFYSNSSDNDYYGYYATVTGVGVDDPNVGEITNKSLDGVLERGSVTLSKSVVGDDAVRTFAFDVSFSHAKPSLFAGEQSFGDVALIDGKGVVYLKGGESVLLDGLPEGSEFVFEERVAEGYSVSWAIGEDLAVGNSCAGVVEGNTALSVTCINTKGVEPTPGPTGRVTLVKSGDTGADAFAFHCLFDGLEPNGVYHYESGGMSTMFAADTDGFSDVELGLSSGDSVSFVDLPVDCTYQFNEVANKYLASFAIEGASAVKVGSGRNSVAGMDLSTVRETLVDGDSPVVTFTNVVEPVEGFVSLHIAKSWDDSGNASGKRPEFVTVYVLDDGNIVRSVRLDENCGWSCDIDDLPKLREDGITECAYSVSEVQVPGYLSSVRQDGDTVTVTNTLVPVGDLRISKVVSDADRVGESDSLSYGLTQDFYFDITAEYSGKALSGVFPADSGAVVFDEGRASLMLKHGESVVIRDLPADTSCVVSERMDEVFVCDGAEVGVVVRDGAVVYADFVNHVVESKLSELPETGGFGIGVVVVPGVALLALGLVLLVRFRRGDAR